MSNALTSRPSEQPQDRSYEYGLSFLQNRFPDRLFFTLSEVASLLRVHPQHMRNMIYRKSCPIPFERFGRKYVVSIFGLAIYLQGEQGSKSEPPTETTKKRGRGRPRNEQQDHLYNL